MRIYFPADLPVAVWIDDGRAFDKALQVTDPRLVHIGCKATNNYAQLGMFVSSNRWYHFPVGRSYVCAAVELRLFEGFPCSASDSSEKNKLSVVLQLLVLQMFNWISSRNHCIASGIPDSIDFIYYINRIMRLMKQYSSKSREQFVMRKIMFNCNIYRRLIINKLWSNFSYLKSCSFSLSSR